MDTRKKLNEFAELRGWNRNKLIGWSEAADFGEWLVKNYSINEKYNLVNVDTLYSALFKNGSPYSHSQLKIKKL